MNLKIKLIFSAIIVALVLGLITTCTLMSNKINRLNKEVVEAITNVKAYELENSNLANNVIEFQYTVEQLNNSKDSLVVKINDLRKEMRIKDKNIERLEYIASQSQKVDSIFVKDTIFVKDVAIDTTFADNWSKLRLQLEYPNKVIADYSFKNEVVIATSLKRETIKPAHKCAFIRWFQKKHNVISVDVQEQNPYCEIKEQKFIKVID